MTDNYLKTVFTKWFNSNKKEFTYFGKKDKVVWISRNKFIRESNLGYEINTYIKEWEELFRNTPEGYVNVDASMLAGHNFTDFLIRDIATGEKSGFEKCGTIYVADGSPRMAYQWSG